MSLRTWTGSALWSSASWVAREAAEKGALRRVKLDARVVSVGNIQAGGAGKTPIVSQIAREACARGLKTCILTRGYLSEWEIQGGIIEPESSPADPDLSGDEPALLQNLVPQAWIAVGADRVRQYEAARERLGRPFDLVILDDGFQHWKIEKDVEVLALTSATSWDRYFRDWPSAVRSADLIVWTKGKQQPPTYGRPFAKVRFNVQVESPGPVWLICGVADPISVIITARQAGLEIRRELSLDDHAFYEKSLIDRWSRQAAEDGCRIAITGKDWVKWRALGVPKSSIAVLEPELAFESGREHWDRVIWG